MLEALLLSTVKWLRSGLASPVDLQQRRENQCVRLNDP
jgi:hypothetical protein